MRQNVFSGHKQQQKRKEGMVSFRDLVNYERALKRSAFTRVCGNCEREVIVQSEKQQCPECGLEVGALKQKEGKLSKKKRNRSVEPDTSGMCQNMKDWLEMKNRLEPKPTASIKNGGKKRKCN